MKKVISIIIALMPMFLLAQTAERQVIGSAGGFSSTSDLKVSSTVGEAVVGSGTSSTIILTQGFQQPDEESLSIEDHETGLSINAYPNPVKGIVSLELDAPNAMELSLQVLDFYGSPLATPLQNLKVQGTLTQEIDFSSFAAGSYFLLLTNKKGSLQQTIKILKVN
ncbi:MAG: T9SS type A sorting domain-containing protein [Bacteroidales bacterium]